MVRKVVLDNGVRVLTEEIPHVRSVSLGVWVNVGSRDESDHNNGISHFIEHMMFKGTKKRTAKEIAESLDAVGGQINAFTTKEYTCYHTKVLDEHIDLAIEVVSDMLFGSLFAPEDIEREKNVIVEEIKMYEDAPDEMVHDVLTGSMWQTHSLGRPIIGNEEIVRNVDRSTLLDFYEQHYRCGDMVISCAGNIKHEQVVEKLRAAFEHLPAANGPRLYTAPRPVTEAVCRQKDTEQVHLCVGTEGLRLDDDDAYVMQVINTVLGGGLSSRLFQKIREERGLVYTVFSYHSSYHDTGLFCVYAGLSSANANQVLQIVMDELNELKVNGVGETELKRTKDQLKGSFLLSLENVNTRMSRLGKSELYLGRVTTPDEVVERLQAVTGDQIKRVAGEMFNADRFSLATIGQWCDYDGWETALTRLKSSQ
ncbi:MAG: insulinase family protein [Desulforudis sp.]|jgi:predicted Zn-dependent peptidase|nr:pitrilysin family protein [Clostridia bacterium]MDQ7790833.1 pitrilysin family protein [Clostridia bacterium]RJX22686.1 MAG: insulinase family protein [Desulforudis sp.]